MSRALLKVSLDLLIQMLGFPEGYKAVEVSQGASESVPFFNVLIEADQIPADHEDFPPPDMEISCFGESTVRVEDITIYGADGIKYLKPWEEEAEKEKGEERGENGQQSQK